MSCFFLFLRILVWRIFSCFDQTINSVHYRILFPRSRKKEISSRSFLHTAFMLKLDEILLSNTIVQGCFCHVVQKKKHRIFNFWLKLLISFVTVHQDSLRRHASSAHFLFVKAAISLPSNVTLSYLLYEKTFVENGYPWHIFHLIKISKFSKFLFIINMIHNSH